MSESKHQSALFTWARNPAALAAYPGLDLLEGSNNGVHLTPIQASAAKRNGMLKGVHDVTLKVARRGFNGLSIELKRPKAPGTPAGVVSEAQRWYGDRLLEEGWSVHYCFGWDEAKDIIEWYLKRW